ncbi:acyltransferase family protein [Lacticaseibacillus jixiensis]|uniref:acyltransferase family protein n=1 Tax=Lacticaseibacillus jixiensis TaxID=3231926 RepID=UPI0036F40849
MSRVYRWDWMRLVLIVLVVFGHLLDRVASSGGGTAQLDYWIYVFHMPAFIFLSGLFAKHNIQQRRFNKIFELLGYYLIAKVILFGAQWLVAPAQVPAFSLLSESGVPWYLFAMFWFELGAVLVDRFDHRWVLIGVGLISLLGPYLPFIGDALVSARFIGFLPYFYLGYLFDPQWLTEQLHAKYLPLLGGVVLVVTAVLVWALYEHLGSTWGLLTCRLPYVKMGDLYVRYGPVMRLIFQTGVIVIIMAIAAVMPVGKGPFVWIGAKTLQVYVFHIPLIRLVNDVLHLDRFIAQYIPSVIMANLLIAVVIVLLCVTPPVSWLTRWLFHPVQAYTQLMKRWQNQSAIS